MGEDVIRFDPESWAVGDRRILDEESIDLDAFISGESADVRAHDEWVDRVEYRIGYGDERAFEPSNFDDPREWLHYELMALFVRSQRETDLGLLEYAALMRGFSSHVQNVAGIGIESYAKEMGRQDVIDDE